MRLTSIYSGNAELGVTTIDPYELNCRVRNGNGCGLVGINISLIPTPLFQRQNQYCYQFYPPGRFPAHLGKNKNRFVYD